MSLKVFKEVLLLTCRGSAPVQSTVTLLNVCDRHGAIHSEIDPIFRRDSDWVTVLLPRDVGDPVGRIIVHSARNLQLFTGMNNDFFFRVRTSRPNPDRRPANDSHFGKLGNSRPIQIAVVKKEKNLFLQKEKWFTVFF